MESSPSGESKTQRPGTSAISASLPETRTPRLEANGLIHASPGQRSGNDIHSERALNGRTNSCAPLWVALSERARFFTLSQSVCAPAHHPSQVPSTSSTLGWLAVAPLVLKCGVRVEIASRNAIPVVSVKFSKRNESEAGGSG